MARKSAPPEAPVESPQEARERARETAKRGYARARAAVAPRRPGRPLSGESPAVNVNVRLPVPLVARLDSWAEAGGVPRSEAIRAAIVAHLAPEAVTPAQAGEAPPELADLWQAALAGASGNEAAARRKIGALTRFVRDLAGTL